MSINDEARRLADDGYECLARGDLNKGALLINRAFALDPGDVVVLNVQGVLCLKKGKAWQALQLFYVVLRSLMKIGQNGSMLVSSVRRNMDLAIEEMAKEGLAHLRASRPARAKEIFYQVLQFSLENQQLRKNLVSALEANGEDYMAFRCAKSLALGCIESQEKSSIVMEKLPAAIKLFVSSRREKAFEEAKEDLLRIIEGLQATAGNLSSIKKVLSIFFS